MGVLLQAFYFAPGHVHGVGGGAVQSWWDRLAGQAQALSAAGFTAVWLPPPLKGASGGFSNGYDVFDDYDLGSKQQKGTIATRYGTREELTRCAAVMRANGIDIYLDLVENQRDGDDGHFLFEYFDAFGQPRKGRFAKGPGDFHPHVPPDPGVFTDIFQFGRDLAPINGVPHHHAFDGLLAAADWLTRAVDAQGFRLDNTKGVSTEFIVPLLNHGALANKFAVGEFADGNIGLLRKWADDTQHRASSFDFPLRFLLRDMCNNPASFDMASLDHAGLTGVDPQGAVTFVENHDSDRGGIGGPIVRNKMLAYAYILTAEGYPCVFYRDYATHDEDPNGFGLKPHIDRLLWIHEMLASGPTQQRWKDNGVFAFERLGGDHLLVALNKDESSPRTIHVDTGFPPNRELTDFAKHAAAVKTDGRSAVTITVPRNQGGLGYVCYAPPRAVAPFDRASVRAQQDVEGAADLDIKPVLPGAPAQICRVFSDAHRDIEARISFVASKWTAATTMDVRLGNAAVTLRRDSAQPASLHATTNGKGFVALLAATKNGPAAPEGTPFRIRLTYSAPRSL